MLDPERGVPPQVRAVLRSKLAMPPESASPAPSDTATPKAPAPATNAPPNKISSNQ
jgi:hypothetical protein